MNLRSVILNGINRGRTREDLRVPRPRMRHQGTGATPLAGVGANVAQREGLPHAGCVAAARSRSPHAGG